MKNKEERGKGKIGYNKNSDHDNWANNLNISTNHSHQKQQGGIIPLPERGFYIHYTIKIMIDKIQIALSVITTILMIIIIIKLNKKNK